MADGSPILVTGAGGGIGGVGRIESLTGQPARTVEAFVAGHAALFTAPEGASRGTGS